MKIAIYSRKSKYTGKGDSIGNQIQMCKDYIETHIEIMTLNILFMKMKDFLVEISIDQSSKSFLVI